MNTFGRATIGFIVLTLAVTVMTMAALWAIETYTGGVWWISGIIVLVAMISEICIYMTTLHEPIYDWIKEPAREKERQEAAERHKQRMEEIEAENGKK